MAVHAIGYEAGGRAAKIPALPATAGLLLHRRHIHVLNLLPSQSRVLSLEPLPHQVGVGQGEEGALG